MERDRLDMRCSGCNGPLWGMVHGRYVRKSNITCAVCSMENDHQAPTDAAQAAYWRGLLKRYMDTVAEAEGVYFINNVPSPTYGYEFKRPYPRLTSEDQDNLTLLAVEIRDYCGRDK